ncbi:MAG: alpha/beta fold hydrolase [Planctomycetota bacterium]|nr:alpha/beta fold hydrolase [Planctomycetota bacterium]
MSANAIPTFEPPAWLRGGRAQTIFGGLWPGRVSSLKSAPIEVTLEDGDTLVALDSVPPDWSRGRNSRVALLVHGLGGSADSPYVARVASRLFRLGVRVVRMNLRGAGVGFGRARRFYHAGLSDDVRALANRVVALTDSAPLTLVGFSLGANLVLKLAGEAASTPIAGFDSIIAAAPPIDLAACARHIQTPPNRIFDRNLTALLKTAVSRRDRHYPELPATKFTGIDTLYQFDDKITARWNGFRDAEEYYALSSSGRFIPLIKADGLVIHAVDDPFIPPEPFYKQNFPPGVTLELIPHGGHLGFYSRDRWDGDHRWLDARIAHWFRERIERATPALTRMDAEIESDLAVLTDSWTTQTSEGDLNRHAATAVQ